MRKLAKIIVLTALAAMALFVESVESRAQGMYFSSIALSVTSLPGTPQGLSNVVVPIPNASVYVCTGTYVGAACSASVGTKATLWSCAALSGCPVTQPVVADVYGNFGFWAAPGSYYYTQTGQVNGLVTSGSYQITLPLACTSTCAAAVFNATTGFQVSGAAPLDYVLLGNGTYYVPSATIPASIITGLPGSFYQTVQAQDSAMPQEANLDFADPAFVVTDSSGNHRTAVNLSKTGVQSSVVSAAGPGTSGTLASWNSAGDLVGSGMPAATPGTTNCLTTACAGGSTYVSGTAYTNSSGHKVTEYVTIQATGSCTGADFSLTSVVAGMTGPGSGITNNCAGWANITVPVQNGQSFTITATHLDGGGSVSIVSWFEAP